MTKIQSILLIIIVFIIVVSLGFFLTKNSRQKNLDQFAQCLTTNKAEFYGAFWCPHCQAQKKMFGSSLKYVSYTECSTPNGQNQLQICKDKKIEGYPTWIFADGSRITGEVPFKILAEKTKCKLPR